MICKECKKTINDNVAFCPCCGYIYHPELIEYAYKHHHLKDGYGEINFNPKRTKNRKYKVSINIGWDEVGHPIMKPLKPKMYFDSYEKARDALEKARNKKHIPG